MLELRDLDSGLISQWDRFVYSMPGGTIFHTLKWLQILGKNQNLHVRYLGIFMGRELIGILPLCLKNFFFIKIAGSPFVIEDTPYMGPIIDRAQILALLPALDMYLKKNGISFLRMVSNQIYGVANRNPKYHFIEKYTHVLDITRSKDNLWKNLEGRCRTAIRKAQKSKIAIATVDDRNFVEKYYSVIEEIYYAQDMPCPNQKELYYDIWDSFVPHNVIFLSAEYHGEIIGGIIVVVDGKRAYYLNGASKHEFRSLSASNLLLWEAINIVKEEGIEQFDFVGANIPRLAKFKKSFGGQLVGHSLIERSSSQWIKLLRNYYPHYRQKVGNLRQFFKQLSR